MGLQVPQSMDPDGTIVQKQIAKAKDNNYDLDVYLCDTSLSHDEIISGLVTQYLKSTKYVAISIGFGVRGNKDHTPLFEKLVNACVEHQPGVKFAFALLPTEMTESFNRVLT